MKLMIVDDHCGARQMIRESLALPGVTLCECASGEEAVRLARDFKPDWITMDVHMPGLNGLQAAAAIQRDNPATRIITVTSDNQPYLHRASRAAGAVGHITKENLGELRQLLARSVAWENSSETAVHGCGSPSKKEIEGI